MQGTHSAIWSISNSCREDRNLIIWSHVHEVTFDRVIIAEYNQPDTMSPRTIVERNVFANQRALKLYRFLFLKNISHGATCIQLDFSYVHPLC